MKKKLLNLISISPTFKLRSVVISFIQTVVERGGNTFFLWDPWTNLGPLIHLLGPDALTQMGIPLDALASKCVDSGYWHLPYAYSDVQVSALNLSLQFLPLSLLITLFGKWNIQLMDVSVQNVFGNVSDRKDQR